MTEILYGLININLMIVGVLIGKYKFRSYVFNPASLYSLIWGIGLSILNFKIISDFYSLNIQANNIFILAWIFFLLGIIYSDVYLKNSFKIGKTNFFIDIISLKKIYFILLSLSFFFIFLMLYNIFKKVGIYSYFANANLYRLAYFDADILESEIYTLFPYSTVFYKIIIYPSILITAIYGAFYASNINAKWVPSYLPALSVMLWCIINLSRHPAVIVSIIYLFLLGLNIKKRLEIKKYFKILLIVIICLFFITFLRNIRLGESGYIKINTGVKLLGTEVSMNIIEPIRLLYGGLISFSETISETKFIEPYYGGLIFKGFIWVRGIFKRHIAGDKGYYFRPKALYKLQHEKIKIGDRLFINAHRTYLYNIWQDFRYLGIILIPFVIGFFSCIIYKIFCRSRNIFIYSLYIYIMTTCILFSTMIWVWEDIQYWVPIFYFIGGYIFYKKEIKNFGLERKNL